MTGRTDEKTTQNSARSAPPGSARISPSGASLVSSSVMGGRSLADEVEKERPKHAGPVKR